MEQQPQLLPRPLLPTLSLMPSPEALCALATKLRTVKRGAVVRSADIVSEIDGGFEGDYRADIRKVRVVRQTTDVETVFILMHELGHAVMHGVLDALAAKVFHLAYLTLEIEADICAVFVFLLMGWPVPSSKLSALKVAYLHYPELVFRCAARAREAAKSIVAQVLQ